MNVGIEYITSRFISQRSRASPQQPIIMDPVIDCPLSAFADGRATHDRRQT